VGSDFVVVNGVKLYLGKCSTRNYAGGKRKFSLNDQVEYRAYPVQGKVWGYQVSAK